MRVCLVSPNYADSRGAGGIATYTRSVARELALRGNDVTVVAKSGPSERLARTVDEFGVLVVPCVDEASHPNRLGRKILARYFAGSMLRRQSRTTAVAVQREMTLNGPFDIVEVPLWNAEGAEFPPVLARRLVTRIMTPIFKVTETLNAPPNKKLEQLERRQLEKSRLILSISDAIGSLVRQHYKLDNSQFRYAPLAVASPRDPVASLGNADGLRVLFVGRLERRKGVDDLIRSMESVLTRVPHATFDVVGEDQRQSPIGSYVEFFHSVVPNELHSRVTFHGFADDDTVASLYRRADLFVAPSLYESFGLVYLEAMVLGIPVIGTRVGGVPEVVTEAVGLLVEPGNPSQLADAIVELLLDPARRTEMGDSARQRALTMFSVESMVESTLRAYREAIALAAGDGQ